MQDAAIATFERPWALAFLPTGKVLVSQRIAPGLLSIVGDNGQTSMVSGVPDNIGILDVKLAPDFLASTRIYFSYMERDPSAPRQGRAANEAGLEPERLVVARATLNQASSTPRLENVQVIFRQDPFIVTFPGSGEPGGRIAFSPSGSHVFISSGDRQELDSKLLFRLDNTLGKMVRLLPDGRIPADNPFVQTAGANPAIWTLGHRNAYGLAFDGNGRLWSHEHGPRGGDEFNLLLPEKNYGWPVVSNGDFAVDNPAPNHSPGDGFEAPKITWTPAVAPAGMIFYTGNIFGAWKGNAIITGLQSRGLIRVEVTGENAREVERIDLGARIRDIAQAPDGSIWIITDGTAGQLIRLRPVF